jgi:tripartite-type tricarboxylate transporter receptor subunit TctC
LGILAPKGTPTAIVDWLNGSIARIVRDAAPTPAWAGSGVNPLTMTPAEFGRYLERDIAKWRRVIESANIRAD